MHQHQPDQRQAGQKEQPFPAFYPFIRWRGAAEPDLALMQFVAFSGLNVGLRTKLPVEQCVRVSVLRIELSCFLALSKGINARLLISVYEMSH